MDLFTKCMETVNTCLQDSKMDKSNIHDVVLVGGSSRIPKVQQLLQEIFKGKDLCKSINADEAVAYGAAVQAALLCKGDRFSPNLAILDITPFSLGISLTGDLMSVVIPRNTTIPTKKKKVYYKSKDNQSSLPIKVCEGERTRASDNNLLGLFYLNCNPSYPKGHPLNVYFDIDADGILTVSAEEATSGNKNEITITNNRGRLSAEQIMIQEAEKHKAEDEKYRKRVSAMNALDDYVYKINKALKDIDISSKLSKQDEFKINLEISKAKIILDASQQKETEVFQDCLNKLKSVVKSILQID